MYWQQRCIFWYVHHHGSTQQKCINRHDSHHTVAYAQACCRKAGGPLCNGWRYGRNPPITPISSGSSRRLYIHMLRRLKQSRVILFLRCHRESKILNLKNITGYSHSGCRHQEMSQPQHSLFTNKLLMVSTTTLLPSQMMVCCC